eukprot:gene51011-55191_t
MRKAVTLRSGPGQPLTGVCLLENDPVAIRSVVPDRSGGGSEWVQ